MYYNVKSTSLMTLTRNTSKCPEGTIVISTLSLTGPCLVAQYLVKATTVANSLYQWTTPKTTGAYVHSTSSDINAKRHLSTPLCRASHFPFHQFSMSSSYPQPLACTEERLHDTQKLSSALEYSIAVQTTRFPPYSSMKAPKFSVNLNRPEFRCETRPPIRRRYLSRSNFFVRVRAL